MREATRTFEKIKTFHPERTRGSVSQARGPDRGPTRSGGIEPLRQRDRTPDASGVRRPVQGVYLLAGVVVRVAHDIAGGEAGVPQVGERRPVVLRDLGG